MGMDKAGLVFDGEQNFLQRLLSVYVPVSKQVVVVIGEKQAAHFVGQFPRVRFIVNPYPERGRNYSIYLGFSVLDDNLPVFIQNVDNPFTDKKLIEKLLKKRGDYEYCYVAHGKKGGHPLLVSAHIRKEFLSFDPGKIHFRKFLNRFSHTALQVEEIKYTYNINRIEDYVRIFGKELREI